MKDELVTAIADLEEEKAIGFVRSMLEADEDPQVILAAASEAVRTIGDRFEAQEYFLPELIIAGDLMKQITELVKPRLATKAVTTRPLGKVVLGTVAGDIHDIGKDVVGFMLDANNFEVHDLGVDVPAATFVAKIREVQADIVGLSGFLTLAFEQMKVTVDAIKEAGLRDQVKIMIGGAIMDTKAAQYIGADAYGTNAAAAVKIAKSWTGGM
jgi:5-methyltetrahydrofolate--homocysteine methyltransferase